MDTSKVTVCLSAPEPGLWLPQGVRQCRQETHPQLSVCLKITCKGVRAGSSVFWRCHHDPFQGLYLSVVGAEGARIRPPQDVPTCMGCFKLKAVETWGLP